MRTAFLVVTALSLAFPTTARADAPSDPTGARGLKLNADAPTITLADAVARAQANSRQLQIGRLQIEQIEAQAARARALFLPVVTAGAEAVLAGPQIEATLISRDQLDQQALLFRSVADITDGAATQNPDPNAQASERAQAAKLRAASTAVAKSDPIDVVIQPWIAGDANITVAVPLFVPRAFPLLDNAHDAAELARDSLHFGAARVSFTAASIYHQALAAQQLVALGASARAIASARRDEVLVRQERGVASPLDVDRAELDVLEAEQQERSASDGLRRAKAALGELMGVDEEFAIVDAPVPNDALELQPEHALIERALTGRDDVKAQRRAAHMADRSVDEAWARFAPSLRVVAQGRATTNTSGFSNNPFGGTVALQAEIPIFDAGQSLGALDESHAQVALEQLRVKELEEQVASSVRGALADIKSRASDAVLAKRSAAYADKARAAADTAWQQGALSTTDLALVTLRASQADANATRADLDLATARLALSFLVP